MLQDASRVIALGQRLGLNASCCANRRALHQSLQAARVDWPVSVAVAHRAAEASKIGRERSQCGQVVGAQVAGLYQVEDETGKIYVLSSRGVPNRGVRVKVDGNVTPGLNVMGKSWGTTIRERGHKVKF